MFNYVVNTGVPDLEYQNIGDFVAVILNLLMGVGVSLSVIFIGLAGVRYITAGGNPDEMDRAKNALTYSIAALVLTVGALAFRYILLHSILGIDETNLIDPNLNF